MKRKGVIAVVVLLLCVMLMTCLAACNNYNYYVKVGNKKFSDDSKIFLNGYGTYNNGKDKSGAEMDRLTSVVPRQNQLDYAELEYYNFIHYGMNTYTGKEWGDGTDSPSLFNPTGLDTDQWCEALKASGSKGIILTAKHHDGFCLWPSEYTDYDIAASPYKNGEGDIVKELSESCARYGLKFGVYLSPWDRNNATYGQPAYNDYFVNQLRELLTNYGEIFSVWFDGAKGEDAPDFEYDYERYYKVVKELQPNAVTCVSGEDVRWVGNEAGVSRASEWCVVAKDATASQNFQTNAKDGEELKGVKFDDSDVGSRELLAKYANLIWKPAEVDVSIRNGWFYHDNEKPKDLQHLLNIYYKAVGGNSSLLLNVPPNKEGKIAPADVARLKEFGDAVAASASKKVLPASVSIGDAFNRQTKAELAALSDDTRNTPYVFGTNEYIMDFDFGGNITLGRIDLREDLRYSQRVEYFDVYARVGKEWRLLTNATNIGNRRTLLFDPADKIVTSQIRIVIKQSRKNPVLRSVQFYEV